MKSTDSWSTEYYHPLGDRDPLSSHVSLPEKIGSAWNGSRTPPSHRPTGSFSGSVATETGSRRRLEKPELT